MTGPILAVIVVAWALVLVPVWVRRHDIGDETRSVDRFSSAMHVLSRRPERRAARYAVVPRRSPEAAMPILSGSGLSLRLSRRRPTAPAAEGSTVLSAHVPVAADVAWSSGPPASARPRTATVSPRRSSTAARARAIRRRQRMLLAFAVAAAVVLGLSLAGLAPMWAPAVVAVLLAVYLVLLRRQTVAERAAERARARYQRLADRDDGRDHARYDHAAPALDAPAARRAAPAAERHGQPAEPQPVAPDATPRRRTVAGFTWSRSARVATGEPLAEEADEGTAARAAAAVPGAADGSYGRPWQPIPIPRPTYVDAPIVPRPARRIFDDTPEELDDDGEDVIVRRVVGG